MFDPLMWVYTLFKYDAKSDVRILNFESDNAYVLPRKTLNDVHRSLCHVKCHK